MLRIPFLLSFIGLVAGSLLAIDYGGEWTKASLIKPGVPFDVLLNRDSKRKIQSSVAWKGEDRLFGGDAFALTSRFPNDAFNALKILLGRSYDKDPYVKFFWQLTGHDIHKTPRGTVLLQRSLDSTKKTASISDESRQWSVEELIAMQLSYIKDLADSYSVGPGEIDKVKDVILTVPPFYTQQERQALADAADIAGLNLLGMISDGASVAVNYAMTRTFEQPEWHVFYDAGATSATASVVGFTSVNGGKEAKPTTLIEVVGVGFDRKASGYELDKRMRDLLVKDFNSRHEGKGLDIRKDKKGMARLLKEASRVKTILSANAEASVNVESIAFDIDFKSKVSREDFEDACKDLIDEERFTLPILDAIQRADLTMDNITSVVLTGGATRTPMIQSALRKAVGSDKIAVNVNADEASVLGAAFYGASLSRQVKQSKIIKVVDLAMWDTVIGYPAENDPERMINTVVFPRGAKIPSKKVMTIKGKGREDFNVTVGWKVPGLPITSMSDMFRVEVTGVKEALGNMTERLGLDQETADSKDKPADPAVKVTAEMDKDGFVKILDAIVWGDVKEPPEGFAAKIKGLFGGGKSETSESSSMDDASSTSSKTGTSETEASASSSSTSSTASASASAKLTAKELSSIQLKLKRKSLGIRPLNPTEKRKSRTRLQTLDSNEMLKRRKDEAHNNLEGYLYRVRDLLSGDPDAPFVECSNAAERQKIQEKLDEIFSWLNEVGDSASTGELWEKRENLEQLERPIQLRYTERAAYPDALSDIQQAHWATRVFLQSAAENATEERLTGLDPKYTQEELDDVERKLVESEKWLNEGVEKQKKLVRCGDGDPPILTAELKARGTAMQRDVMRLLKRKAPPKRKPTSTESETKETSTVPGESTEKPSSSATESVEAKETTTIPIQHTRDEL